MLQYQTRAGILPNPCNCGFFVNEGLQRISLYVKSRFCLETHAANSQRCRCKAFPVPPPGFDIVFFATGGLKVRKKKGKRVPFSILPFHPSPSPPRDCVVIMIEGGCRRDRQSGSSALECGRLKLWVIGLLGNGILFMGLEPQS
jgi:hypothetical protein